MADDWDDNNTYTDLPLNYEELEEMENEWADRYQEGGDHYWDVVPPVSTGHLDRFGSGYRLDSVIDAPQRIRQLYEMCQHDRWQTDRAKCFYRQAQAMADYTDDCPEIANFNTFRPTFADMSILQMRSYFTLRTLLRQGRHPEAALSYLQVYTYETLMLIGVESPEEGLAILSDLKEHYGHLYQQLGESLSRWIKDFVVYYGMEDQKERCFALEIASDKTAMALANYTKLSDDTFFIIMEPLQKYKIKEAALYKKHPADTRIVAGRTLKAAATAMERQYQCPFDQLCLGVRRKRYYTMFDNAVFHAGEKKGDEVFEVSPRRKYVHKNGLWIVDVFAEGYHSRVRETISEVLHETDRQLRDALGVKIKIKSRLGDRHLQETIEQVVSDYMKEKAEAARPKIEVDFSKLARIRADADVVRDALLADEEKREVETAEETATINDVEDKEEVKKSQDLQKSEAEPSAPSFCTAEEAHFLQLLMSGADWSAYLRSIHVPAGVMTENINGKMMDELGDIVLDDDGSGPAIIDDYLDDVKAKMA